MRARILQNQLIAEIIVSITSLLLSLCIGAVFILAIKKNPLNIYLELIKGTLGNSYGFGQVLFRATSLIFTGLAVSVAFHAGLFNIGCEGQLIIGSFLIAWVGFIFQNLPQFIHVPLCILAGVLAGAFWAAIPGILKAKTGAHEVITTIMLNYIAYALINFLVIDVYGIPETVHTPYIANSAQMPNLFDSVGLFPGSMVNVSIFLALLMSIFVYYLIWKTKFGYELRAVGLSQKSAKYAGINISRIIITSMIISGGIASLVGTNFVLGYKHYYEEGFSGGVGFMGIAVALLGRNHPFGIILASILFGILSEGGLVINPFVPKEMVQILQAIIIITVITLSTLMRYFLAKI